MAPRKDLQIRKYFKFNEKQGKSICLANKNDVINEDDPSPLTRLGIETNEELQCKKSLSGFKVSNLKSHLRVHDKIYKLFLSKENNNTTASTSNASNAESEPNSTGLPVKKKAKITDYGTLQSTRSSIKISKKMLLRSVLSKVTIDGRPFVALHDVSYQIFLEPAMKALGIHFDRNNIGEFVEAAAMSIKEKLKKDFEHSMVCVKVDCATRSKRSYLGMNVQVVKNGEIKVYTLAMKEVTVSHTGENLKKIILQELLKYGIKPKNIYCITSDNGKNFLKAVKLIEEEQHKQAKTNDAVPTQEAKTNDAVADKQDDDINTKLMDTIRNANWEEDRIMSIHCAAHTLQLCVSDTLKGSWEDEPVIGDILQSYMTVINAARKVVIELRTQNVMNLLKEKKLKRPTLDVNTRWSSTYLMLKSLLALKDFCDSCAKFGNDKLRLSEEYWRVISEVNMCLEPCYKATKKLQYLRITLTDIYKIWNTCHMETAAIGTTFSNELVINMIKRRDMLMEHPAMLSAIYLDPRFCFELSEDQKAIAVKHIAILQLRLMSLETERQLEIQVQSSDTESPFEEDEDAKFERLMKSKYKVSQKEQVNKKPNFNAALIGVAEIERMSSDTDVLKFWSTSNTKGTCNSILTCVAEVVFSVAGTQVSVEQLFSQLRFILSDLRDCLLSKNVENILIVRCNFDIIDDSFFINFSFKTNE